MREGIMLYFIHGYQSDPNGTKGILFQEILGAHAIHYRNGEPEELVISECLQHIHETIKNDTYVMLIGSSLGGFLAAKTALQSTKVKKLVLLNPALIPPDVDISKLAGMPLRILSEMKDAELFTKKIDAEILVLLGTQDAVVPNAWGIEFAKVQEAHVRFLYDDHQFSEHLSQLPKHISYFFTQKH